MSTGHQLTRAHERLREELEDDGIVLPGDDHQATHVLQELHYARRPPIFEGRSPLYGSLVIPGGRSLVLTDDLLDLVDLNLPIEDCRRFADGRASFLVHREGGEPQLACFRRTVQYEADLVEIQAATGASIIQRTVMGTARVFTDDGVIEWNGQAWVLRPSARIHRASVTAAVPEASPRLITGLLDLCVHWLSPSHIGATLLLDVDPTACDGVNLDLHGALTAPKLSVKKRHHYAALFAALGQSDLATLVELDGSVTRIGVGLRSTEESEIAVPQDRGMRHRSAARYTWDHHHTVAFVVSEDGPVTVFRKGLPISGGVL